MAWMGAWLVHSDEPFPADVVVVLAGDPYGNRILKGADLVKQGFAPKVLVSGPAGLYDLHECDLAIPCGAAIPLNGSFPFPTRRTPPMKKLSYSPRNWPSGTRIVSL